MIFSRVAVTPAAQSVVVDETLISAGWTSRRTRARDGHQISHSIAFQPPPGSEPVELLLVRYPHDGGQLAELIRAFSRGTSTPGDARRFPWRLSILDAPAPVVVAAARLAIRESRGPTFDTAMWEGWESVLKRSTGNRLAKSTFVHPTGQVVASYHYPVGAGECGGWTISTPTVWADATGHTPGPLVRAVAESLLLR